MKKTAIMILAAVVLAGCFQGRDIESGPEKTLETFYERLCSGDFDEAAELCSPQHMDGYIDECRTTFMEQDSTVRAIASDILSETIINITNIEKDAAGRKIFYELTLKGCCSKDKTAILRKEERGWKIEQIIDRN